MSLLIESAVSYLLLIFTMQALFPLLFPPSNPASTVVGIGIQVVLYGCVFVFTAIHWRAVRQQLRFVRSILVLVLLAILSTTWSQYMSLSLRRGLVFAATTMFGIYFAARFTPKQQFRTLAAAFLTAQVLSITFALVLPQYGTDQARHAGAWQGVFHQKNELGRSMVFAALLFLYGKDCLPAALRWLGLTVAIGLLFMSHSAAGVVVLILTIASIPLVWVLRQHFTVVIPIYIVLALSMAASALLLGTYKDDVLAILHRSDNLTGRTHIWAAVVPEIASRPFLGYGYDAFWLRTTGASADVVSAINFMPAHAHNGFLDVLLELGLVGLLVFLFSYFQQWPRVLAALRQKSSVGLWSAAFLVALLLYNAVEGPLMKGNMLYWILYVAMIINLAPYKSTVREADHE